jgi:hypothetical protein
VPRPHQIEINLTQKERGKSHDELGLLSRLALQALLQLTGLPVEFSGPTSCEGHPGFKSLGHDAEEQLLAEGMIIIGRLNPSTRDTTYATLSQSGRFRARVEDIGEKSCAHHRKSHDSRCPGASTPPRLQAPHPVWRPGGRKEREGGWVSWVSVNIVGTGRTVPERGSHRSPPLQPPSRQLFGPVSVEKLQ